VTTLQLVALARNPVPSGAHAGMFNGYDGNPLRYAIWRPSRAPTRGTVCVFPGRGEYIEKYFEVVADLRRRGFFVAVMDWRGQGGSWRALPNRNKGYVRSFREYDDDLLRFMKDIVLPDCPPPFVALAHSMGGNILLRNARLEGSWFERMVLVAPMLALNDEQFPVPRWLARPAAELATLLGLGKLTIPGGSPKPMETQPYEGNRLTSDRERFARNKAVVETAPELGLGSPTLAWMRAAFASMSLLWRPDFASSVRIPVLMLAAGDDRIVSATAIEEYASRLKIGAHVLIPGARHEIVQERDELRLQFWATFDAYLGVEKVV